tara:strand:+ start:737 stop:1444 length:708 start_codon:yes stop_codon:yes gene_type:complete
MSILEIVIIIVLSVFQSIFGVGLLIIGTPIFLQLGYDFYSVLNIILPFSIIVSFLQFITDKSEDSIFKRDFFIISVPSLMTSLVILKYFYGDLDIEKVVAFVMIIFSIVNILVLRQYLKLKTNRLLIKLSLVVLGLLHGLTNLGGSLLTLISSNISKEKIEIRSNISFGYLIFGVIQLSFIVFFTDSFVLSNPIYFIIPILAFFVSQKLYQVASSMSFSLTLNTFVLIYGIYILI